MKALKYLGPEQLEIREEAMPVPAEDEALLRIKACGICGSDVHGYLGLTGRRIPPMTMGHEFSAEVVETGKKAQKFKPGDGVVVQPINFCGYCENCKKGLTNMCLNKRFFGVLTENGAMAEYLAVPEKLLYPLPEGSSYECGALAEPYAVAHGAVKKAGDLEGKTVLIIGAGTIGLCILQLVMLHHPQKIIISDLSDNRLLKAKQFADCLTVNPGKQPFLEKISELTEGHMIDVSIEAVGVQATANQAIQCLTIGGRSIWVGMSQKEMTINMQDIVCPARTVIGSFNYTHEEFGEVASLLGSGKLNWKLLVSGTTDLEHAEEAFKALHERPDDLLKIIIKP